MKANPGGKWICGDVQPGGKDSPKPFSTEPGAGFVVALPEEHLHPKCGGILGWVQKKSGSGVCAAFLNLLSKLKKRNNFNYTILVEILLNGNSSSLFVRFLRLHQ